MPTVAASVTQIHGFLTLTGKVSELVALVALFVPATETAITVTTAVYSAAASSTLWAISSEMTHAVAFVTGA